jgi:eukaryotic-like serine/threonine-protein kinase
MRIAWVLAVLGLVMAGRGTAEQPQVDNQFLMTYVNGMYWVDAEPKLRALGWKGVLVHGELPGTEAERNRIMYQDPRAGTTTNKDAEITLWFGR